MEGTRQADDFFRAGPLQNVVFDLSAPRPASLKGMVHHSKPLFKMPQRSKKHFEKG